MKEEILRLRSHRAKEVFVMAPPRGQDDNRCALRFRYKSIANDSVSNPDSNKDVVNSLIPKYLKIQEH